MLMYFAQGFSTKFFADFCSGRNLYGELGQGNNVRLGVDSGEMGDDLIAIQLGDGFIPNKVVAGGWFNCVLSTGNAIKCFGESRSIYFCVLHDVGSDIMCHHTF